QAVAGRLRALPQARRQPARPVPVHRRHRRECGRREGVRLARPRVRARRRSGRETEATRRRTSFSPQRQQGRRREGAMNPIEKADADVWAAIAAERRRQQAGLEMIASENYTSPAVLAAQGSELTNKYAEGYPGRRYYGGCEHVDVVERLAIERVCKL